MRVIDLTTLMVQGKDIVDCFLRAIGKHGNFFAFLLLEMQRCDCKVPLRSLPRSVGVRDNGDIHFCAYAKLYKQTLRKLNCKII
jgi:hypothetical protein